MTSGRCSTVNSMDRGRLVSLLEEGLSIDAIAAQFARSPSTVSYWLKRHGLDANGGRKYGPKPALDRDSLAVLVDRGLSVPAIASELGCPASRVRYWLGRYSLETRQTRNRAAARAAFREGQRIVELSCRRHGETAHVLEGRGSYRCTRCRAEQVAEHRRRVKRVLIGEAGGSCRLCGYGRCEAALEFHHLDPRQKEFHLSVRGITRSISALRVEAAKCVLLCATCHAEVEAGMATVE